MKKIGIIAAMAEEFAPLCEKLGEPLNVVKTGVFTVKKYIFCEKEIFFANCTVGEIMAAACTQYLITAFGVELVLNYGLAGSLTNSQAGKTLLIKGVVHYDFDTSALDGEAVGKYGIFDSNIVQTDCNMRRLVKKIFPHIEEAVCASGDKFIADGSRKEYLFSAFGATVCEMEAAGVLFTCLNNSVPQIIIKVISDSGDDAQKFIDYVNGKNVEYIDFVCELLKAL